MFPPPDEGDIVVWACPDGTFEDAWDGIYFDPVMALSDASGGLSHPHDAFHRPGTSAAPWPFKEDA